MNVRCHLERSEGPHNRPWITQATLLDQGAFVRSLAVCGTRDDRRAAIENRR